MAEFDYEGSGTKQEELDLEELESEGLENLEEIELVGDVKAGGRDLADQAGLSQPTPEPSEPPDIREFAAKVYAMELVSGEFVRGSGTNRSYLRLWNGEDIERARVMATIVQSFISNDRTYCALTLDDGTETIRAKGWREDAAVMESFEVGQIVDVIGHIREYDGEVYLSPITIHGISDPNWEPLRELEIYKLRKVRKNDLQL